jgi:hypothetical protein
VIGKEAMKQVLFKTCTYFSPLSVTIQIMFSTHFPVSLEIKWLRKGCGEKCRHGLDGETGGNETWLWIHTYMGG